jgi:Flp pilus assembly protein TadG
MGFSSLASAVIALVKDKTGNFAAGFAILVPLLLGVAGGAVDMIAYHRNMQRMQDAADTAALAAAREGSLKGWDQNIASSIAATFASENLGQPIPDASGASMAAMSSPSGQVQVATAVDAVNKTVKVTLEMDDYPYFFLGYFRNSPQIRVTAQANVAGEMNICVIGLDPAASGTVQLTGTSKVTAPNCAIMSNSVSTDGFVATDNSLLTSDYNCSAGGIVGAAKNFTTNPTTDCRPVADPLAARGIPPAAPCNYTNKVVSGFVTVLSPGVYCGGINIKDKANVLFKPGTYVIKNGELKSNLGGISAGKGVTFVFVGEGSRFAFDSSTTIGFSAPETGPYAGILFYQDPAMVNMLTYEISSVKAGLLLGTIYLPNGTFKVHAANKVGEQSAFTVIVARKLDIGSAADLVINAEYAATKVPVPKGVGPLGGGNARLTN